MAQKRRSHWNWLTSSYFWHRIEWVVGKRGQQAPHRNWMIMQTNSVGLVCCGSIMCVWQFHVTHQSQLSVSLGIHQGRLQFLNFIAFFTVTGMVAAMERVEIRFILANEWTLWRIKCYLNSFKRMKYFVALSILSKCPHRIIIWVKCQNNHPLLDKFLFLSIRLRRNHQMLSAD